MSPAATPASSRITKPRAAAVSIASNSILIALKLAAGAITGSVAILSEALHSMIDLIASVIAFVSVRRADEPADVDHPYGHEKLESLAASIEGMLILAGAALIIYESVHRLATGASVEKLGIGIAVIGFSALANGGVSVFLRRQAKRHGSPALAGDAAHLGTDALTSLGVLVGLVLVQITGAEAIDSAVAIAVAMVIVLAGVRIMRKSASASDRRGAAAGGDGPDRGGDRARPRRDSRRSSGTTSCGPARPAAAATSTSMSSSAAAPPSSGRTSSRTSSATRSSRTSATPRCSSTWSRRAPAETRRNPRRRSEPARQQVDGGGEAHRADDDAVARVAPDREQDHRDPADDDDGEPRALLQSHARYFDLVAPVDAPTLTDPGETVAYLQEISPEMRGCAVLSEGGEVLAATGNIERWGEAARDLVAAADAAGGEPVAHAHIATGDGEAFCVREAGLTAVAVADRFTLSSLMLFDMRNALRSLAAGAGR